MHSGKTTLYAVRHGETEWNALGRYQGYLNSDLTERGIRQAEALATGLEGRGIGAIYSSDLKRAAATAQHAANILGLEVEIDSRLRERNLGILQGNTRKEFAATHPEVFDKYRNGGPDYAVPGGESERQFYDRVVGATQDILTRHCGATILIVCHSGVIRSLFHHATQLSLSTPRHFSLINCAINSFTITDNNWTLQTWGNIDHLHTVKANDDF